MSVQDDHKTQIAYEVVEKYEEHDDQEDFEEAVLDIVELDEEGFARGIFVALQVIISNSSGDVVNTVKELVESAGGIEWLEQYLEADNEADQETINWYHHVFQDEE